MRLLIYLVFSLSAVAAELPMKTRVFRVPVELIGGQTFKRPIDLPDVHPVGFREPLQVFEPVSPEDLPGPPALRQSAKAVLVNEGIPFPAGARAEFNPQSGMLVVHNTPVNLEHVRLFLNAFEKDLPVNHSFFITVVEAPGEVIRSINSAAGATPDCRQALASLLVDAARPGSGASLVGDGFLECFSGRVFRLSSMREHLRPEGITSKAARAISVRMEQMGVGLQIEGSVIKEADDGDLAVELSLKVSTLPPAQRMMAVSDPKTMARAVVPVVDHWQALLQCSTTMQAGQTRLIGITKPPGAGDSDVLWAAFLQIGNHAIPSVVTYATSIEDVGKQPGVKRVVFDVFPGLLEHYMPVEPPERLQQWLDANGLAKEKAASAECREGQLVVVNTQENLERVHGLLRDMHHAHKKTAAFTFQTVAAPAWRLREVVRQHVMRGDHSVAWKMLESDLAAEKATLVNFVQFASDGENNTRHESGHEFGFINEFATSESGQIDVGFDRRMAGTIIDIESSCVPGEDLVGINLDHETHTRPPETTKLSLKPAGGGQFVEFPLLDFFTARTNQGLTLTPGAPRMLSLCRPADERGQDVMWATFVWCHVQPIITSPPAALRQKEAAARSQKVETRAFQFPQVWLGEVMAGWGRLTSDDLRQALLQAGIRLPASATLHASMDSGVVRVTAPACHLDDIAVFVKKTQERLHSGMAVTAHLIEVSAELIRHLDTGLLASSDHSGFWRQLQNETRIGRAKNLTTLQLTARSDSTAKAAQTRDSPCLVAITPSDAGGNEMVMEKQAFGHQFEVSAQFASDSRSATLLWSVNVSQECSPPAMSQATDATGSTFAFPSVSRLLSTMRSSITMPMDSTRLVWASRPPGGAEDVVHLLFLQTAAAR